MRRRNLIYNWLACRLYNRGFPILRGVYSFYNPDFISSLIPTCDIFLSVGGGTGEIESRVAKKVKHVINYDSSMIMLKESRHRFFLDCVNGVSEFLPYQDQNIDCILISESIGDMALSKTFEECYRVLKRGGHFIVTNYAPIKNRVMKFLSPAILGYKMYSAEEFEVALLMAGFENYSIYEHVFKSSSNKIPFIILEAKK